MTQISDTFVSLTHHFVCGHLDPRGGTAKEDIESTRSRLRCTHYGTVSSLSCYICPLTTQPALSHLYTSATSKSCRRVSLRLWCNDPQVSPSTAAGDQQWSCNGNEQEPAVATQATMRSLFPLHKDRTVEECCQTQWVLSKEQHMCLQLFVDRRGQNRCLATTSLIPLALSSITTGDLHSSLWRVHQRR